MIRLSSVLILSLLLSSIAFSQPPAPPPGFDKFTFQGGDFIYMRAEFGMEGKLVKGSPYSAQVVTEFTQTLADGNRIHRTTSGSFARDSEGRTRREQTIGAIGSLAASGNAEKSIFIQDPVAGLDYVFDPKSHTARAIHAPKQFRFERPADQGLAQEKMRRAKQHGEAEVKTEDLGTQVMEGVTVQGKRVTRTIPAGQIGNERPLQVVTETWSSPDLQTVVMSKTSDPRSGESVYKLVGISRAEPDPALFGVPADYTLVEGGPAGKQRMAPRHQ